jgi:alkanesulfonate monooxygenase SsuD/methylene tetrahydromethanopterin reductase-like flavin-dependent oxidoreductase (luciferase family)
MQRIHMTRFGAMFDRDRQPEELADFARQCETLGYDELWVVEDCFWTGGVSSAAVALAATERITVGIGIAPAPLRNPALLAMEIAALARYFPGRIICGIGHGVRDWMAQVGALAESQLTLLEETITAVRSLLHGNTVTMSGRYVQLNNVALVHPPRLVPPVLAGVMKPKSLTIAGRVADGTILSEETTPESLRDAIVTIDAATVHDVTVFAFVQIDDASWSSHAIDALCDAGAASVVIRPVGADHSSQVARFARSHITAPRR